MDNRNIVVISGTLFGIRIRDAAPSYNGYSAPNQPPRYNPYQSGNVLDGINNLKAGALRTGSNALRFKVEKIFWISAISLFSDWLNAKWLFIFHRRHSSRQLRLNLFVY